MTADSKPGSPRWLKVLANTGFVALVVVAFSLYNTLHDINRQNRTTSAITELCDGMQAEEVYAVMKRNGVTMHRSWGDSFSFQDRPYSLLDYFDPSVKITQFCIGRSDGLWLVKTTNYRFYLDEFEIKEHHLNRCENSPRY